VVLQASARPQHSAIGVILSSITRVRSHCLGLTLWLPLRQLLQRYFSERHAILLRELLRSLDPSGYLQFLEPGTGSAQMRRDGGVVPLGMGERRQVDMRPCQVIARLYGINGGFSMALAATVSCRSPDQYAV
jgi:hypothetical protein